ncbi:MAG: [FeFe] hydrogenase H-cluster maturation GTPase HydF [Bacteroidales bacterium]|nr:[FeFe] hydrogenase H-cluster maturation GTPase HydF [Bacteroidales bacterium]
MKGNELKPRIGIFGRRNVGKSSLINYLTGQDIAIVSDTPGSTTDPVRKTMEIGGVGPVVWVDTAGIDDEGSLGVQRIGRSLEALRQSDLAIILFTNNMFGAKEQQVVECCREAHVPFLLLYSQSDKCSAQPGLLAQVEEETGQKPFVFNVFDDSFRTPLLSLIRDSLPESAYRFHSLLGDVLCPGNHVVMVTPIDSSAPEGRMILPQVQVLRDVLDNDAVAHVCKETDLERTLQSLAVPPRLVVTDSQAFALVSSIVPEDMYLTSFSIVLARAKGLFDDYLRGTPTLAHLREGDAVLLLESCTHNVTCEDIGRVKLPKLIQRRAGCQLHFDTVAGFSALPRPLTDYAIVIQCGGCVVSPKQLAARLAPAIDAGVPVSNYGLALAYLNGIFDRAIRIFDNK